MSLRVSVLITNYETWPDAARCARKVIEHCGTEVARILIMDDASATSPPPLPEEVEVKRHKENQGFPRTLNSGFEVLDEEVIVHFDADGHPLMDFVPRVSRAFSSDEQLGALGFHMVDREDRPTGSHTAASEISTFRFLVGQRFSSLVEDVTGTELLLPNACGTAIRRKAFQEIGGFDDGFELLDVDLDFFLRLNEAGWGVEYNPEIRAYHEGGGTPQSTATRVVRHHRDRWHLLRKHGRVQFPRLTKFLLFLRHALEYGAIALGGSVLFPVRERRRDKQNGRRQLIQKVWTDYQ